jgi:hypothetical protein
MKILLLDGKDFRPDDADPSAAIVNETFAKTFLSGENPIGRTFEKTYPRRIPLRVVGLTRDARYSSMRESTKPVVYVPFRRNDAKGALQAIAGRSSCARLAPILSRWRRFSVRK